MSVNKSAYLRYRIIDACLRDRQQPYPSKEFIIKKCEERLGTRVSESTFEKDLQAMRAQKEPGYYAPVKFDKQHNGYYYDDPAYSIESVAIKDADMDSIEFGAALLQQCKNMPALMGYASFIDKIMAMIKAQKIAGDSDIAQYIRVEKSGTFAGAEHFETLFGAIKSKEALTISYLSLKSGKPKTYLVHPYLLREFRQRWYLAGLNQKTNELRTFELGRIISASPAPHVDFTDGNFDVAEYSKNAFGARISDGPPVKIRLQVKKKVAHDLIATPLHQSQKTEQDAGKFMIMSLELVPDDEFISFILSLGNNVIVLEPGSLQNKMKKILRKNLENYRKIS